MAHVITFLDTNGDVFVPAAGNFRATGEVQKNNFIDDATKKHWIKTTYYFDPANLNLAFRIDEETDSPSRPYWY